MRAIIDRFEGDYAVCETEEMKMINIEKNKIPIEAKEGDVLILSGGKIKIDHEQTKTLKKQTKELMDELWE